MDLAELLKATTTELLNSLHTLIEGTDQGVVEDVFDRRGLTFDDRWQVRALTLDHEDVAILIHDLAKAARLSAWFNSLEVASQPTEQTPIPGIRWRWFFHVYSTTGRRVTEVRVSAESEAEAITVASGRIDLDRVLGRAIPYRPATES